MFLFLSKITVFFLSPFIWMLVLLISLLLTRTPKRKRMLTIAIVAIFMIFGNEYIYNRAVMAWQAKPVEVGEVAPCEAGILLGGLGSFDKHGRGFLNGASDRLIKTAMLYHAGRIRKVIISGGSLEEGRPREADFLRQQLLLLKVDATSIYIENNSRTTFENGLFTKRLLNTLNIPGPYMLISSAMHLPRAVVVFKKAGLQVRPFPSHYTVWDKTFSLRDIMLPKLQVLEDWQNFLKEVVGMAGYRLFGKA